MSSSSLSFFLPVEAISSARDFILDTYSTADEEPLRLVARAILHLGQQLLGELQPGQGHPETWRLASN
jgi:hypothetical protein